MNDVEFDWNIAVVIVGGCIGVFVEVVIRVATLVSGSISSNFINP